MELDEMKNDSSASANATLKRTVELSPAFVALYANDTQLQTSPWDVRFQFGLVQDVDPEARTVTVQQIADVRMSLQHAKRVAVILQQQIDTYEKMFGAIPQPPNE